MPAGRERVRGGTRIHVQRRLAAQPQWHVRADRPAQRALAVPPSAPPATILPSALLAVPLGPLAPVVAPVHVPAGQVRPGLALLQAVAAGQAWEGQRVEAHRALRAPGVQLQTQRVQVPQGGRPQQALGRAPQQGGTAQVHQGAVLQRTALPMSLRTRTHNTQSSENQHKQWDISPETVLAH